MDFEFGWASNLHNWVVFQVLRLRRRCMEGKFQLYKLIGCITYLVMPWKYRSFKGGKIALSGKINDAN